MFLPKPPRDAGHLYIATFGFSLIDLFRSCMMYACMSIECRASEEGRLGPLKDPVPKMKIFLKLTLIDAK